MRGGSGGQRCVKGAARVGGCSRNEEERFFLVFPYAAGRAQGAPRDQAVV